MFGVAHAAHGFESSPLPGLTVLLPALGALAVLLAGDRRERLRNSLAVLFTGATFACCALMLPTVLSHGTVLSTSLDAFFGNFRIASDPLGAVFALVASLLWLLATVYSYTYIQHEEHRTRYHAFSLATEAATLGVFLSSDFFVLFVFFELMGLLAYALVVHNGTREARYAGTRYIFMTVYGGLSLLAGILLFLGYAGNLGFAAKGESAYLTTSVCFLAAGFMMGGFGVKAGMVPLHVWLPLAHPAAPSPASALLSGVMIKAGAFGFLRVIQSFQSGEAPHHSLGAIASRGEAASEPAHHLSHAMHSLHKLGWVILLLAMVTMVVGAVLALVQDNVKRLLAYSSISQMGYILMGVGLGGYLGAEGAVGLSGALYHIMNHAMFKGLLFLGVGAVYYATHQLDMTKLGGLWRKMPVTCALTCIAGMGIMGIPLFNGFASKTLLHHAVVEALPHGGPWLRAFDITFMIAAGGTACYIAKLISLTFFGHHRGEPGHEIHEVPVPMRVGMGLLACGVVLFGLFPATVMKRLVIPALGVFTGLDHHAVHHLSEMHFFTIKNLLGVVPPLAIGAGIFLTATRWDLFRLRLPETAGIGYYYSRTEIGFLRLCFAGSKRYAELRARYYPLARSTGEYLADFWKALRKRYREFRRAVLDRAYSLPMDVSGLTAYLRARQFTGDLAFGVILIAAVIAVMVLALI